MELGGFSNLNLEEKENKDILDQASLYLNGKSLRTIGGLYNVSHVTIRNNFLKKLKNLDSKVYEDVIAKLHDNITDNLLDKNVIERAMRAYRLLVKEDKTILEIVDILNFDVDEAEWVSEFTIYRDLTVRFPKLHIVSPDLVTEEMLENIKIAFKRHSNQNAHKSENEIKEEKKESTLLESTRVLKILSQMFPTKDKLMNFLAKAALTFGLRLEALSQILGIDIENIRKDFEKYHAGGINSSLDFLFYHGFVNQEQAINDFYDFFVKLVKAVQEKDKESIIKLLKLLEDVEVVSFMKKHKPGDILKDEIGVLIKYQLKYGLPAENMTILFGVNPSNYISCAQKFLADKPKLKSDFDYVNDYYASISRR